MSAIPKNKVMQNESLDEEIKRKGGMQRPDWLNVEKQLTFYASYHTNPINITIHLICIPILFWSFALLATNLNLDGLARALHLPGKTLLAKGFAWELNGGTVMCLGYWAYFMALEPVGALYYIPYTLLTLLTTTYLHSFSPSTNDLKVAGYAQLFGWVSQFAGHGFAEGRAPALLDNLLAALVLAPFFSHLEMLFMAFNYNPRLQKVIKNGVAKDKMRRIAEKKKAQ